MGRIAQGWRRFWGIRPGTLRRPVELIGGRGRSGALRTGPHGRGAGRRASRLRRLR